MRKGLPRLLLVLHHGGQGYFPRSEGLAPRHSDGQSLQHGRDRQPAAAERAEFQVAARYADDIPAEGQERSVEVYFWWGDGPRRSRPIKTRAKKRRGGGPRGRLGETSRWP